MTMPTPGATHAPRARTDRAPDAEHPTTAPETLTVLYDGACPLCRREIAHLRGLADNQACQGTDTGLRFVDVSAATPVLGSGPVWNEADRGALLARFHVQRPDGNRLSGAAAFVAVWRRLPGWRWLARAARLPGVQAAMEVAYRLFLKVRPLLQTLARWLEQQHRGDGHSSASRIAQIANTFDTANSANSAHMVRELRSDHAGETGAVAIYRGIAAVAAWRGQRGLLAMALRHQAIESEHLRLLCERLPPQQRSRLLGAWRLAGWLTGALPALAGPRAVYATIAAVETFVDRHYQQQIDHLVPWGDPEHLLPLLRRCQADEREHLHEAHKAANTATRPGSGPARLPLALRAWCASVAVGSALAVALARRF